MPHMKTTAANVTVGMTMVQGAGGRVIAVRTTKRGTVAWETLVAGRRVRWEAQPETEVWVA
jgi:hypothetical protein